MAPRAHSGHEPSAIFDPAAKSCSLEPRPTLPSRLQLSSSPENWCLICCLPADAAGEPGGPLYYKDVLTRFYLEFFYPLDSERECIRGILWVVQSIDLWLVSRPTEGTMKPWPRDERWGGPAAPQRRVPEDDRVARGRGPPNGRPWYGERDERPDRRYDERFDEGRRERERREERPAGRTGDPSRTRYLNENRFNLNSFLLK
ncbi:hypothetical protein EMIHUDRAFT_194166 [Emiliania huxleyi CCMP1516]|uniref:Uncharacterized protein n=2 Tax=Emiliania huxleyi TaxID=2903 RepID=A0A0D3L122_EMIH1|nr:hypothetical protein EMIHUDRAFT_194166 [Emiliania huxleyi CCMP1516]EOD41707.1 hypothetical protein EMIHUDRAFT_194166 [Emiliania huxleyi CCMP1516]|eukprot:XP_005794136.1 hypothetical protein EMIHUDRAFT_194166 [Emiliania huxleyi CCMP1516]